MSNLTSLDKKKLAFLGFAGVVFLGVLIYSNILLAPFVFDDVPVIAKNQTVKSLSTALSDISNRRYVGFLSFALNYAIGGLKPFGYHLVNVLIHVSNALLVYCLVTLLFQTPALSEKRSSSRLIAVAASFLFVAHPIQTQAVTYISQRFASLATMFYLISVVCYLKARLNMITAFESKDDKGKFFSVPSLRWYLLSLFSAVLAMKSKEIAMSLPFAVVLSEIFFFEKGTRKLQRLIYTVPFLLTLLIIPLSMLSLDKSFSDVSADIDVISKDTAKISRADYLVTQFRVIITYLRLLVFPVDQNFDYVYPVYNTIFSLDILVSLALLLTIVGIAIWTFKKERLVSFGIVWFFLTLSVESGLIPIRDVINEHRVYLPSVGFFIAMLASLDNLLSAKKIKIVLLVILISVLSIGTFSRNIVWTDPEKLWTDVISKAPDNARAYNNLGVIYKDKQEYEKANEQFEKALKVNQSYTAVYYNLGDIQYKLGNYDKAIIYLQMALSGQYDRQFHVDILNKLGRTYSAMGKTNKAIEVFEEAVKLFPSSVVFINNLGVQYIKNNQIDEAIELYEKALEKKEVDYLCMNLSIAYKQKGEITKSRLLHQKAMSLKRQ